MAGEATHKFVVVLSKKLEAGVALNAASHMTAALVARATAAERERMSFAAYRDADGNLHPSSLLSLIVLRADNSNKIRQARQAAIVAGIACVDFMESMTRGTYVEQLERTSKLKEAELEYWGICLFGEKEALQAITSTFSLWK